MSGGRLVDEHEVVGPEDAAARGDHRPPVLRIPLDRRFLLLPLLAGLGLCVVSMVWQLAEGGGWQPASQQLDRVLNVDEDLSVLNWVSASVFLLAALLAAVVAGRLHGTRRRWWWVLALGVLFVSVDEAVGVSDPVRVAVQSVVGAATGTGGLLLLTVVVVGAVALACGLALVRALPPGTRWRVVVAVALVGAAAVGIDSLGPDLADRPEDRLQTWYVLKATLEEAVELVAAVLLLDGVVLAAAAHGRSGGAARVRR